MSLVSANILRAKDLAVETPMAYPVRGSAKAWLNMNGQGTIAVRDSLNVASITDTAVGTYSATFSAAMEAANYSTTLELSVIAAYTDCFDEVQTVATGSIAFRKIENNTTADPSRCCFTTMADLA